MAVRKIGVLFASLGRIEIWSSSSASQLMLLRKRSRFPEKLRKLLLANTELPYTTNRAGLEAGPLSVSFSFSCFFFSSVEVSVDFFTSMVATTPTGTGPCRSFPLSKVSRPRSSSPLSVSAQLPGPVSPSFWTVTPCGDFSAASTERAKGKSEARVKSRVIGWE